jgi:VWFA-related protein
LTPPDFQLAEDGVVREIARLDAGTMPLQVALLLDASESMRGALRQTQEAAAYFVESMQPGDRVTLITFNSDIRSIAQTGDDLKPILDGIRQAEPRGITKLYDALLFAMKYLSEREGRKAIVVFTDGEDTAFGSPLGITLRAAAIYGYPIYTLSAGEALKNQVFRRTLQQLAEVNSARMFLVEDPAELRNSFRAVADELRSTYVLNYYTQVPRDGQWHTLDVRVNNPKFKVHTRKGFYASAGISPTVLAMPPSLMNRNTSVLFDSPVREEGIAEKSAPFCSLASQSQSFSGDIETCDVPTLLCQKYCISPLSH